MQRSWQACGTVLYLPIERYNSPFYDSFPKPQVEVSAEDGFFSTQHRPPITWSRPLEGLMVVGLVNFGKFKLIGWNNDSDIKLQMKQCKNIAILKPGFIPFNLRAQRAFAHESTKVRNDSFKLFLKPDVSQYHREILKCTQPTGKRSPSDQLTY
jgi:hypothetical protein